MKQRRGFTVLELAITLIIAGVVMVPAIMAYNLWVNEQKRLVTEERLDTIKRAVDVFITKNRILPCPARQDVAIDTPNFGISTPNCWDLMLPTPPGVTDVAGASGGNIRIGDVPVRSLGLPDEYAGDKWGRRFIYAATRELSENPTEFRNNLGAISLVDNNGNSLITPPDNIMFVVASTGPDGLGGRDTDTAAVWNACSATSADRENCDNDNAFSVTSEYAISATAAHFDDFLRYELKDFVPLSTIKEYIVEDMPCSLPDPNPGLTPNWEGEQCASGAFNGDDIYIDPLSGESPASDGLLIYSKTFVSKTDGRLIVRVTLPAAVDNSLVTSANKWEEAIHAAVYIDNVMQGHTVITDPTEQVSKSYGYTSLVLASDPTITNSNTYTIDIYIYSFGNAGVDTGSAALSGWAGTIRHSDHDSTSKLEIMEIQDF